MNTQRKSFWEKMAILATFISAITAFLGVMREWEMVSVIPSVTSVEQPQPPSEAEKSPKSNDAQEAKEPPLDLWEESLNEGESSDEDSMPIEAPPLNPQVWGEHTMGIAEACRKLREDNMFGPDFLPCKNLELLQLP